MTKNLLCCAMFAALGIAQVAVADDSFDNRWYATAGFNHSKFDNERGVDDVFGGSLGFGRFVAPRWSWDVEAYYANPEKPNTELNWSLYALGVTGRYHVRDDGDSWWPYVAFGLGAQRHEDEFLGGAAGPVDRRDTNIYANFGGGLFADLGRTAIRAEAGLRYDLDDSSPAEDNYFVDKVISVTLLYKFGDLAEAAVEPADAPAAPVKTCADMDDDGDGVNNCNDKCAGSQAGQAVGPDGCPVPLTIDLRGVNFDFDKSELRPDAIAILDEAIGILAKYPQLKVEVAGHTDAIGTDAYNQSLSERRAKAVYDYLASKGIDGGRLVGPNGYGESRPIAPNNKPDGSDDPEGRAKNRRTELNVQN